MNHTADDIAAVIIERHGPWTDAMVLQKLLYYVQAWHLAVTDEPIFPESFKAWSNGPVVPQVWHSHREQSTRAADTQNTSSTALTDLESGIIDLVVSTYGSMSGDELSALTHAEDPWREARGDLPDGASGSKPINQKSMAHFYRRNRQLGGHTAADLAAGGIPAHADRLTGPIDVDAILSDIEGEDGQGTSYVDRWGGANLITARSEAQRARRANPWKLRRIRENSK
jgi:uncharacterized phage-associated protein